MRELNSIVSQATRPLLALPEDLHHHFEAVSQMTEEDQKTIESIIEGMIAKYQTRAMVSNFKN